MIAAPEPFNCLWMEDEEDRFPRAFSLPASDRHPAIDLATDGATLAWMPGESEPIDRETCHAAIASTVGTIIAHPTWTDLESGHLRSWLSRLTSGLIDGVPFSRPRVLGALEFVAAEQIKFALVCPEPERRGQKAFAILGNSGRSAVVMQLDPDSARYHVDFRDWLRGRLS